MTIQLTPIASRLLDEELATGRYASAAEAVEEALELLARQNADDDWIADLKQSAADMDAGRVRTLAQAAADLYREFPNLRP